MNPLFARRQLQFIFHEREMPQNAAVTEPMRAVQGEHSVGVKSSQNLGTFKVFFSVNCQFCWIWVNIPLVLNRAKRSLGFYLFCILPLQLCSPLSPTALSPPLCLIWPAVLLNSSYFITASLHGYVHYHPLHSAPASFPHTSSVL